MKTVHLLWFNSVLLQCLCLNTIDLLWGGAGACGREEQALHLFRVLLANEFQQCLMASGWCLYVNYHNLCAFVYSVMRKAESRVKPYRWHYSIIVSCETFMGLRLWVGLYVYTHKYRLSFACEFDLSCLDGECICTRSAGNTGHFNPCDRPGGLQCFKM